MERPLIFVTNDDGYRSAGIKMLVDVASRYGDVIVVAPLEGMSGMGHAITTSTPLRYKRINGILDAPLYVVEGTPVDCVKIAMHHILGQRPNLLLSGINHGSNASVNIIYSGTMAAAFEGAMAGVPSIGFSLADFNPTAPMEHLRPFMETIIENTLKNGLPDKVCLNVNFPSKGDEKPIKGIKVCSQAIGYWKEEFDSRLDPHQRPYFWLKGKFIRTDKRKDTDLDAMKEGYAAMVPVHFDFTAEYAMKHLTEWDGVAANHTIVINDNL